MDYKVFQQGKELPLTANKGIIFMKEIFHSSTCSVKIIMYLIQITLKQSCSPTILVYYKSQPQFQNLIY